MKLVNPERKLLPEFEDQLFVAKKTAHLFAKLIDQEMQVETLEGTVTASAGDFLCRGIKDELWPQSREKLYAKYVETDEQQDGWTKFVPHPDTPPVYAAKIDEPFQVEASWGNLEGKPGDFLIRSFDDPTDMWIVAAAIFETTYSRIDNPANE